MAEPMEVVMRQISGLGNQLFQYAAGRYYAEHHHASFRIAINDQRNAVSHGFPRPFLLSHFNIQTPLYPLSRPERLIFSTRLPLRPAAALVKRWKRTQVFHEPVAQRYTFIKDLPLEENIKTLYLVGYWQAYEMVESREQLREELSFRSPASGKNLEILNQIARCQHPVSLHVRRGDYTLTEEGKIVLPIAFYEKAIAFFQERYVNPVFFIFSDDIAYTRAHLPAGISAVFVDHNNDSSAHEDLRLMSSCHDHIIANSSFSWWGAWLNQRKNKVVFAPKYWHLLPGSYFPELIPPNWILETF